MSEHPHRSAGGPTLRPRRSGSGGAGGTPSRWRWRVAVPVVAACAGLLATTSMINAQGTDLRGGRHSDLIGIVGQQRQEVQDLRRQVRTLESDVESLAGTVSGSKIDQVRRRLDKVGVTAGTRAITGPGLVVKLDDAPLDQPGVDDVNPNTLVVHQQDIQAVVNALWDGGAEGITIQGQRIISTTGIKCVGSTVVLQGVPYSPPYKIAAVGDTDRLYDALNDSTQVQTYLDYTVPPYNLGWSVRSDEALELPAYTGPLSLSFAQPAN